MAKRWTKEEIEYLMSKWGSVSIPVIAKRLGRTESSITNKARRLKLGPHLENADCISLNQLYMAMRGSWGGTYTKQQWIDKGLSVRTHKVKNCSFLVVNVDDFWEWAEKNRTILDFSNLEENILGKEPDWVKEQRKIDKMNSFFKRTPWTPEEDKLLTELLKQYRYTYKELSIRLRRTEGAIKRRVIDLRIKHRPLRMPNHNPWTVEETNQLIELYNKGHGRNTIARYIDRSSQACSGKIERLIKEGVLQPRSEHRKSC